MTSSTSGLVEANNYQIPDDFVRVIATDQSDSTNTAQINVVLTGITVGVSSGHEALQAGSPAIQLNGWVNGTTNKSVTWSLSAGIGSLSYPMISFGNRGHGTGCQTLQHPICARPLTVTMPSRSPNCCKKLMNQFHRHFTHLKQAKRPKTKPDSLV